MSESEHLSSWWTKKLLGQAGSPHPILGEDVKVRVTDDLVELTGTVDTPDTAEEFRREAKQYAGSRKVAVRLRVLGHDYPQHMQTVIGLFANEKQAQVAAQGVHLWGWEPKQRPEVLVSTRDAKSRLHELGKAACLRAEDTDRLVQRMTGGKALLLARLPEDDAFRAVSNLEGSAATLVTTLPPEPDALED